MEKIFEQVSIDINGNSYDVVYLDSKNLSEIIEIENRSHLHPWQEKNFHSSFQSHHCIGLRSRSNLIAYAIISFVVGEAELLLFVLDKPFHGKGFASSFMKKLVGIVSARASTIFLEVRLSNASARNLYEAVGFHQVGTRAGYYPGKNNKREDAILYMMEARPQTDKSEKV